MTYSRARESEWLPEGFHSLATEPDQLTRIAYPDCRRFQGRLSTLILVIAMPVVPPGERLIYPRFNRPAVTCEDEVSRKDTIGPPFSSMTVALQHVPGWLNGGESCFNETLTLRSVLSRCRSFPALSGSKEENIRCCLVLYVPMVILHLIGAGFYLAGILLPVVIPVNLPVALAAALTVRHRKFD